MFLTFSGATEGEAPSISATLRMLRMLMYFRTEGSGLLMGGRKGAGEGGEGSSI